MACRNTPAHQKLTHHISPCIPNRTTPLNVSIFFSILLYEFWWCGWLELILFVFPFFYRFWIVNILRTGLWKLLRWSHLGLTTFWKAYSCLAPEHFKLVKSFFTKTVYLGATTITEMAPEQGLDYRKKNWIWMWSLDWLSLLDFCTVFLAKELVEKKMWNCAILFVEQLRGN